MKPDAARDIESPPHALVGPAKWAAAGSLTTLAVIGLILAMRAQTPPPLIPLMAVQSDSATPAKAQPVAPVIPVNPVLPVNHAAATSQAPDVARTADPTPPGSANAAAPVPVVKPPLAAVANGTININLASAAEIELLPRIGPAIAQRIIDYRTANGPFRSLADLDKVRGIGPRTLEQLKNVVRFE